MCEDCEYWKKQYESERKSHRLSVGIAEMLDRRLNDLTEELESYRAGKPNNKRTVNFNPHMRLVKN